MNKSLVTALACTGVAGLFAAGAYAGASIEPLTTTRVAVGLSRPLFVTAPAGDYKRLFIVEQRGSQGVASRGAIRILDLTTNPPTLVATPFLNVDGVSTASEQGLLGLAFHPDYWTNGQFYVTLTAGGQDILRRYTVTADPNVADPASAQQVWAFADPFSNHNGGWIGFGPDGYLYWSMGDGGSGSDPGNRAQTIVNQPLGKIHRLDINGDAFKGDPNRNYAIPPTNPFLFAPMATGDDEIWAYGVRNPWRSSFDRLTGDLWIGDVGQDATTAAREEIDFQTANVAGTIPGQAGYQGGRNYGWRCMEGSVDSGIAGACDPQPSMILPIIDYHQGTDPVFGSTGASITGGYVYRGCAIPTLRGTYFFADYIGSRIWSIQQSGGALVAGSLVNRTAELDPVGALSISSPASFGEDARGELYVVDLSGGEVFKVVPVTPTVPPADLNCDTHVNGLDLAALLAGWGLCPFGGCLADLNGDRSVNGLDLAAVLAAWTG